MENTNPTLPETEVDIDATPEVKEAPMFVEGDDGTGNGEPPPRG